MQFDSIQWGVGRSVATTTGGGDRETSQPSFSEISLTKMMDKSSIDLFIEAAGGKKPQPAILNFVNTDGEGIQVYHSLELENTLITAYSSSSSGDRPNESITLNFTKILVKYSRFGPDGTVEEISPKGWDCTTNTKV